MPIDTKHPSYIAREEDWTDCRQAYEGQRAIKAAKTRHLPKLSGQTEAEYDAYRGRALFYSITSKTVSALLGMALDKPPEMKYPDKMKSLFEDHSGTQFYEVLSQAVSEVLLMGRFGALIDRPKNGGAPFVSVYCTEDVINWEVSDDGHLILLVLREYYYERSGTDKFTKVLRTRYRELSINAEGFLEIKVHTPQGNTPPNSAAVAVSYEESPATTITNTGVRMTSIPFVCVNPLGLGIEPHKPPMLDIVDINLSHYRTSADLEHGRHFTGLPTPYVTGGETDSKLHIGSTSAWVVPAVGARVGYLEFTGQGLASLEKALAEKQSQLASLSARLIDNSSRGSEAAETVKLRYMSETASLRSIIRAVEAFLNLLYNTMAEMEGLGKNVVTISLHKDFLSSKITAGELKAWVDAYLAGGVTKEMLLHALKVGDALPPPGVDAGTIPDRPAVPAPQPANSNTNQS